MKLWIGVQFIEESLIIVDGITVKKMSIFTSFETVLKWSLEGFVHMNAMSHKMTFSLFV